jgi:chromosome segregation ATPase
MRTCNWLKSAVMLGALCLAGWATYAQQQDSSSQQTGDPVADAARKAREEKKNAQKAKKVFTDDDVKPATPDKPAVQNATAAGNSGAQGATATTAAASTQKAEDATAKEDANSEKAWRKRFSEQHEKIARAEKELDILQRELEKSQVQYYADPQKAMTEQNNRAEVNEKTAKIDAKKKELDALRQQLDDMETELRKAGGDPGWAQ